MESVRPKTKKKNKSKKAKEDISKEKSSEVEHVPDCESGKITNLPNSDANVHSTVFDSSETADNSTTSEKSVDGISESDTKKADLTDSLGILNSAIEQSNTSEANEVLSAGISRENSKNPDATVSPEPGASIEQLGSSETNHEQHKGAAALSQKSDQINSCSEFEESILSDGNIVSENVKLVDSPLTANEFPKLSAGEESIGYRHLRADLLKESNPKIDSCCEKESLKHLGEMHSIETTSEVDPSAPCEENVSDANNEKQRDVVSSSSVYPEAHVEDIDSVLPYTDSQLMFLYRNNVLESNETFIENFVETQKSLECHELYVLLDGYLQSRNKLIIASKELEQLQQHCRDEKEQCWKFSTHSTFGEARCADGKLVKASGSYNTATFDNSRKEVIAKQMKNVRDLINEKFSLYNHEIEMAFLQIETYIYNVLSSTIAFMDIPPNAPVKSNLSNERSHEILMAVDQLKICVGVFFHFQRIKISDFKFVQETRNWLTKVVSVLLRVASTNDHLFLLNHVLRCPSGVSKWAGIFVNPPPPPTYFVQMTGYAPVLGCDQLDLSVTCLATILFPVQARERFLNHFKSAMRCHSEVGNKPEKDVSWTMVDSDGEEDENPDISWLNFQENDLVFLFNQIPFADIFRHILFVENKGETDDYDVNKTTEQSMLKLMAFATALMHLLRGGITTYSAPRYHQFNKRLCQTVRDVAQFVAEHVSVFKKTVSSDKNAWIMRIEVEFDQLLLRAAKAIYSSTCSGAWQFLAELSYKSISLNMLWKVLWLLHHNGESDVQLNDLATWKSRLHAQDSLPDLEEKLSHLPISEAFHLLNTFASMASARKEIDKDFIQAVSIEVFKVSFLSCHTRDACSKEGRNLLTTITMEHTFILSVLLDQTNKNLDNLGKMSIYLFSGLPLHIWNATEADFEIIIQYLQQDASLIANQLARSIISGLNWSYVPDEKTLFFDSKVHRKMALAISKCSERYNMERRQFGLISQVLKQVSQVTSVLNSALNQEQKFILWVWEILPRFQLHVCDSRVLSQTQMESEAENPERDLHNCKNLKHLAFGIASKQGVACYIALMFSTIGHRKSELCTEGFRLLKNLIDYQLYIPALHVLSCITPLFYASPEFLANDSFVSLIKSILFAEITYFKLAKNLIADLTYFEATKKMIAPTFPGPILKEFSAMVENGIEVGACLGPNGRKQVIYLWMSVLTKIPDWNNNNCTLFILNKIVCCVFDDSNCMNLIKTLLQKLHKQATQQQRTSGMVSSLISWISSPISSIFSYESLPLFPWFAYAVLEAEEEDARNQKLWLNLITLLQASPSLSVEAALKKSCSVMQCPVLAVRSLSIYRWAYHALETPNTHPIYPLMWQKFFYYYLQRVPAASGSFSHDSVGMRFFSIPADLSFLKSLKKSLIEAIAHHRRLSSQVNVTNEANALEAVENDKENEMVLNCSHHEKLISLLNAFLLWLEEPQLHEATLYTRSLPDQYYASLLDLVINSERAPWTVYVNSDMVKLQRTSSLMLWDDVKVPAEMRHQMKTLPKQAHQQNSESCHEVISNMLQRIRKYPVPASPPTVPSIQCPITEVTPDMLKFPRLLRNSLQNDFRVLIEQARMFGLRSARLFSLDFDYLELIPDFYYNADKINPKVVPCQKASGCTGPVTILLKENNYCVNEGVRYKLEQNRSEYGVVTNEATTPPPSSMTGATVHIENSIKILIRTANWNSSQHSLVPKSGNQLEILTEIGADLFYAFVSLMDVDIRAYPPTASFIGSCVDVLGREFIYSSPAHCVTLLETVIKNPHMSDVLSPLFRPSCAPIDQFITMYSDLSCLIGSKDMNLLFTLLTKFDFSHWLQTSQASPFKRSTVISIIGQVIMKIGIYPDENVLVVYDIYRVHLRTLLLYQFPEHYQEVLQILLKGSETHSLMESLWYDVICFLGAEIRLDQSRCLESSNFQEVCKNFASQQSLLSICDLEETLQILASHFMKIRVTSPDATQKGLFAQYRPYALPIGLFTSLIAHAIIAAKATNRHSQPLQQVLEKVWKDILAAFAPWILPISNEQSTCPPWTESDKSLPQFMMSRFAECVEFSNEMFNVPKSSLSFLWNLYGTTFASSPDHVASICHECFISLPWNLIFVTTEDVMLMVKVLNECAPECVSFMGQIFLQVHWRNVINFYAEMNANYDLHLLHTGILQLFLKLSFEESIIQTGVMSSLLADAETFRWSLVKPEDYNSILSWFVDSCDPLCVLLQDTFQTKIMRFLQTVGAFHADNELDPGSLKKQCGYIKHTMALACSCSLKYPMSVDRQKMSYKDCFINILNTIESIVCNMPKDLQQSGSTSLVKELLSVLNNSSTTKLQDLALASILEWITHLCTSLSMVMVCLSASCLSLVSMAHMTFITEGCIEYLFKEKPQDPVDQWHQVTSTIVVPEIDQDKFISECINNGCFLTLYSYILQEKKKCEGNIQEQLGLLASMVDWCSSPNLSKESEAKLMLIYHEILTMSLNILKCQERHNVAIKLLQRFCQPLNKLSEDRNSTGLRGALGLGKKSNFSTNFRVVCRSLCAFILAQITKDPKSVNFNVRMTRGSPGHIRSRTHITQETVQAYHLLDQLKTNKNYLESREVIQYSLSFLLDMKNSFADILTLIAEFCHILYRDRAYLQIIFKKMPSPAAPPPG